MPDTFEQLLDRAAAQSGIEPGYWDIWGRYHDTSTAAKQAILQALGIAAGDAEQLEQSLAALTRREWQRLAPPSVVCLESGQQELPLNVPVESLGERARFVIVREDGELHPFEVDLRGLPQSAHLELDGSTRVRKMVRLPVRLPLGYHEISVEAAGASAKVRFIVTPERAWVSPHLGRGGRAAGIAVSLYGVRSARNWGCGDFGDLGQVVDFAAEQLECGFVALNPLHAIHNRRPFNTSPYLPNCTFYQNFIYLDVERLEDFARCRRAVALRNSPEVAAEIAALRDAPLVEYERVSALKLRFLKLLFVQFLRERENALGAPRVVQFNAYRDREGDLLEKFATYCALDEYLHRINPDLWVWPHWPAPYRDPESPETVAFRRKHWRHVMFYQYVQWQIDLQLSAAQKRARDRRLSIGLYHDLALATDSFGSDLWAHRPFYVAGCRVGSPPDDFSPKGQDWGFPPPNSARHREDGYRLFAESIRKNCRHGGALRIDHVMRLFRLFWIPDGSDATAGRLRTRADAGFRARSGTGKRAQSGGGGGRGSRDGRAGGARNAVEASAFSATGCSISKSIPAETFAATKSIRGRRWSLRPRTICRRWRASGWAPISKRAGPPGRSARRSSRIRPRSAPMRSRRCWICCSRRICCAIELPRNADAYPELTGPLHNAVVGFLALTPSQLLAINQEDLTKETGAAESSRHHLAVSQLGAQDAFHRGAVAEPSGSARVRRHAAALDD